MKKENNLSRRNFLGLSGAIATGLAISGQSSFAKSLFTEVPYVGKKFKIGILGCGNRSKTIISALNSVPEIEIAALCDVVAHKTRQRAELIKTGAKPVHYTDMDKMFKQSDLDAIAVITPNYMHKDHVIAALEAGKDVFCEKPLAMTVAECNAIIKAVKKTGKSLQIGTQRRHSPEYRKFVEVIRSRPVGKILQSDLFDYRGDWRVPEADEYPKGLQYWRLNQAQSGGVVYEMGAHIIDVNNWVFDSEPVAIASLQAVNNSTIRKRDSADHAGVLVQYANGAMMNYGGNVYNYGANSDDTFFFENASVQMGGGRVKVSYGYPRGLPQKVQLPEKPEEVSLKGTNREGDGVVQSLQHFAKVLAGTERPYPDATIGRQSVQVLEGSVRAARERRVIDVKELG
jgi:predicted dehydrogenase